MLIHSPVDSFEIDNETGLALSREEVSAMEYKRVAMLQRAVFHNLPLRSKLDSVWSNSARKLMTRSCIEEILSQLSDAELVPLTDFLGIERTEFMSRRIIEECLMFNICKFESMADKIHMLPLFPTEGMSWPRVVIPCSFSFSRFVEQKRGVHRTLDGR